MYAIRSYYDISVLHRPFANRWLNLAVLWELLLLFLIVYLPPLQTPFATFALSVVDWWIITALSVSVIPVLELRITSYNVCYTKLLRPCPKTIHVRRLHA